MNRSTIPALTLAPLLLAACTSADTASMLAGLGKAGLTPTQAQCASGVLAEGLDATIFNQIAENLQKGATMDDAVKRARRKLGTDVSEQMSGVRKPLDACLR